MPPRSDDPRRDATGSRRGPSRAEGTADPRPGEPGGGGISGARAYTPRGRTIGQDRLDDARAARAEQRRVSRGSRSGDPFRPALQVLDGGRAGAARAARREPPSRRSGVVRNVPERGAREEPPPRRRPARRPPKPPRLADPGRRLRLGTALTLTLFAVIGIRLVGLQAVESSAYADAGLPDRLRTVKLPAPRGAIYDRSGAALVHSVEASYVYADPTQIKDRTATAKALSPLLGIPASALAEKMKSRMLPGGIESQFEYLARGVDVDRAKQILALKLPGINIHRDERREVPGGDLAANLLGFTSVDMNGLEGLEARYDDVLRGVDGKRVYEVGLGDTAAAIPGGYSETTRAEPGRSLQLTIDRDLQYMVQVLLKKRMEQVKGSTGAAIVLEVDTGEVLAQAAYPTYDAAKPVESDPADREDVATSFVVDPGSVHKAITFGAALQEGVVTPDTTLPVPNTVRKGDTPFTDSHKAHGRRMSLAGMMAYSSNVGTIAIADMLGRDRLIDYQKRFGLGEPTGVGVPGEASGRVLPADEWSGSSYGSVPIGHSVDATPLQMAAAFAAIANDGTYVAPRLVKEIIGPDGERTKPDPPTRRSVLSPDTAAELRTILEAVTTVDQATGLAAAVPEYRVAGKTGTGSRLVDGRQQPGEVASFIGMAPAEEPRYVIAVFAHTPAGGGGDIAAPAFRDMMQFALRHYRVPPSATAAPNFEVFLP
ncbi:penicillin-binding protein 2 [Micromonospora sp. WMMA1363]|uniref:peptidoglycan D,D-transpeptidase FtsI family protein n=1 Tax=Micromonospora sp. WMMA1363 TaxID=3053985 RepID=UPI00259D0646|nr:penicillin-binding protein 2 [Micromonospora sp. WMMA1363]MDM4719983.1 penicillin-binding protein 2 [Micromonospora sp. WMMA1363]